MTFGEKIKKTRLEKKLTQKQLADLVGAKHNSVSDWENNKTKPDVDMIENICGVLDLEPNYLLGEKKSSEYGELVGELMSNTELLDLIDKYNNLDDIEKKAVKQIVLSLSQK